MLQTAADIVHNATKKLIELSVEGAKVIDLCIEGDKLIEQGTSAVYNKGGKGKISKGLLIHPSLFPWFLSYVCSSTTGLAFPTSISVNNTVSHFSPLA